MKCPPMGCVGVTEGSRLTSLPTSSSPSVVLSSVSAMTSNASPASVASATVRQQPETQIECPCSGT